MKANLYERRRLRLGALLYQLRYYADPNLLDAQGRIMFYRYDQERHVEVLDSTVHFIHDNAIEVMELEEAILRCKEALAGTFLPGFTK
jgi:hypothetical protein